VVVTVRATCNVTVVVKVLRSEAAIEVVLWEVENPMRRSRILSMVARRKSILLINESGFEVSKCLVLEEVDCEYRTSVWMEKEKKNSAA
jgi:hypothetical protein